MKDLLVIVGCTRENGLLPLYRQQLTDAGIDLHVENFSNIPGIERGGELGWAVQQQRRLVEKFLDYEKLVITDAWDVVFYGTKEDVLKKIPEDKVLLGAERNCYPDPSLAGRMPGTTPWRYVNGGMSAGTPENYLRWFEKLERHPWFVPGCLNQAFYNELRAQGSELTPIDEQTELFYCFFLEVNELQWENGLPVNTVLGTRPNFLHFNGKWESASHFANRERSLQAMKEKGVLQDV